MSQDLKSIIKNYKEDKETVFNSWFVNNDERLKAFRSIRRGVFDVIQDIKNGDFGNDFKGSSLEFVLNCITEQKQVFKGASHPFYWKPKLRIPDIYEIERILLQRSALMITTRSENNKKLKEALKQCVDKDSWEELYEKAGIKYELY